MLFSRILHLFLRAYRICFLLICVSIVNTQTLYAQNASIQDSCMYHVEGYVLDLSTNETIPFANVQLVGTKKGVVTNQNGYFRINHICEREFDLMVSFVGYKTITHHHDTYHDIPNILLAPEKYQLESVVIEGNKIPGNMYSGTLNTLSKEEFTLNQSQGLGDLASRISGVNTLKTGQNVVKPIIHGLHSNRVLIINNGIRHEFQNWGIEHAPEIDPSLAENISVLKGAATVRYGPDALGGVLSVQPSPLDLLTSLQGEVDGAFSTNGRSLDSHLKLHKGFKSIALQAQASYTTQGDLHSPDYLLTNTGKKELSTSLSGRYHWKFLDVYAYYSHFEQELGILRSSITGNLDDLADAIESNEPAIVNDFSYQINNPRQLVSHDVFKLKGLISTEKQSLEAIYAIQLNNRLEFDIRRGTNNERPAIDLRLMTQSLDIDWKHPDYGKWKGNIGLQALYQDNNNLPGTNTVPFIPNYNNSRIGLYIIESAKFESIRWEWGLRYDFQATSARGRQPNNDIYRNDLDFQNVTASLGLIKSFGGRNFLRSNLGTAWRPPNISELYSFGKHSASIEYGLWRYQRLENNQISADEVLSENDKVVNSEMGIKWINTYEINRDFFQAEFTAYINFIQNYIYTTPAGITQTVRGAFPFFIYEQNDALFTGLDANVRIKHTKDIESDIRTSFLWAKNLARNDYFVGLPPANIFYALNYKLPDWWRFLNQNINAELSYTFRQFFAPRVIPIRDILTAKANDQNLFRENQSDFDILPPPDGYFLMNIGWNAEVDNFKLNAQIKNVFNTTYRIYTDRLRYFADDLGRNFSLGLSYRF